MTRMYAGEWTGTMALTEPHAGSSLADVTTRATPRQRRHLLHLGSKIFISGGDHDLTDEHRAHDARAHRRRAGRASRASRSSRCPKRRLEDGKLVPNDVHVAGVIHKIGWRGMPSLALDFGDAAIAAAGSSASRTGHRATCSR